MEAWAVLRVILSTVVVIGLIRLASIGLARYAPKAVKLPSQRAIQVIERQAIPGGNTLYLVRCRDREILIGVSRLGIQALHSFELKTDDACNQPACDQQDVKEDEAGSIEVKEI